MKIFTFISMIVTFLTFPALAQLRDSHSGAMDGLKDARKQLEMNTELTILEKLEASRLADEKIRREKFESLNFSVVNENPTTSAETNPF
jgi:hypothetical protein